MSHGSVLQNFNSELEKSLESIYHRRENVMNEISKEEEIKNELELQKSKIQNELIQVDRFLEEKYELKGDFDKVIFNSENAFKKILEHSKILMNMVKKEEANIVRRIEESK